MFEYFPTNYVWNLATVMALNIGGNVSEIDDACRPLTAAAASGDDRAAEDFFHSWMKVARRVEHLADRDAAAGHALSASRKYHRASVYYLTAERMQGPGFEPRAQAYERMLECFEKYARLGRETCVRVEVPYRNTSLPALFVPGQGLGPRPCMVHFDGLDVMKELLHFSGISGELARRGISTLIVDHPGVGEALRLRGLTSYPETEVPAKACFDYLETRDDVDPKRTGIMGLSLGGYYAPRAAAFEKRAACCVAWGAIYDWGELFRRRLAGVSTSQKSVPHFFDHAKWVLGQKTIEDVGAVTDKMNLRGVLDKITCPILITHGENDRQVTLEMAKRTFDECTNSPKRELKVHTVEEGGAEHCSADNFSIAIDYMADWIAETLGGKTA